MTGLVVLFVLTLPPLLPTPQRVIAAWQPSEAWLYDRSGVLLDSERVAFKARRLAWVKLADMSPALIDTVIAAEDRRFRDHGGVDWLAVGGAARARLAGERSRGASTLSMQVAGFLSPGLARPGARGWLDKLRQMRAAWALESVWSKDEILEAYLNLAGFRGEAQGIGAASQAMFGKAPDALTASDAAIVVALLPDPNASVDTVAGRACRASQIVCDRLKPATANALSAERSRALDPGLAPHLAARLLDKPGMRVTTTLDAAVQRVATQALSRQLQGLGAGRARDGAVVVLDNASGDVLAYVGGVGLGSTAAQVDGANAYRQAGSTLKPFLYAQVIEKGWLTPASILDDSPVQLDTASGLYVPQNYDHSFKGPVSVRTALAGSLNVPAVRTLLVGGVEPFRDRLWDTGYHGLTEDGQYYGFSLALGSAEVTLLEQANAYRSLANGGRVSPLRLRADDPVGTGRQVLKPAAAWIVSDILADASARSTTFGTDSALRLPFWAAVKTGTSKAMRDNWCVGFTSRFTVAVWVGNLEGDSMKAVSGTSGAAPVWRDVMIALERGRPSAPPPRPPGVEARRVSFANAVEPPRTDWFLTGTAQAVQAFAPPASRRPRITNPVSGSVFALDPDIPIDRQRMGVAGGGQCDRSSPDSRPPRPRRCRRPATGAGGTGGAPAGAARPRRAGDRSGPGLPCADAPAAIRSLAMLSLLPRRPRSALRAFLQSEAAGGMVLIGAAALAMLIANSGSAKDYFDLLHFRTGPALNPKLGPMTVHLWINDALMSVFFLLVGLEIKREFRDGHLASWSDRRLPFIAAAAGMAVPAMIYLIVSGGDPALARGWAIPAATDIAFALGLLALLGKRVPTSLKLFLTTVAIVDDVGAVAIIALFYTSSLDWGAVAAAIGVVAAMAAMKRAGLIHPGWYFAAFVALWFCTLLSGVHATIAGVVAALMVPLKNTPGTPDDVDSPLHRMEHALQPWVAFGIVPLFGFANAGVALGGAGSALAPLPLAIALGLVIGKQVGVFGSVWLAVRYRIAKPPARATWTQLHGVALLCGIGFTMSLFIGGLAFPALPLADAVKLGVLLGSVLSAVAGVAVLRFARR